MKSNNNNKKDKEFKTTQTTSSPGALGEDVNRNKRKPSKPIEKESNNTSKEQGLNQEQSAGNAGAFEGFEDAGKK